MKKLFAFILAILMVFTSAQAFAAGNGKQIQISAEDEKFLLQHWENEGVDKATQKKLLDKIKKGETLDSDKPENIEKVSKALAIKGAGRKKVTFRDGSFVIQSVSGGTVSCGTGYCNYTDATVERTAW
ncbi:hypothetical protein [Effusibacillus consociatus]|uniref:Uncharacterized protein n=1 Tax=Effusibacillus consociatus TaxID=1117041 RepID=A0ABV9Q046_9BACL